MDYSPWDLKESDMTEQLSIHRCVITFLPKSKSLLISWLQSPSDMILDLKKIKSATVSPFISHEVMGLDAMIFVFFSPNDYKFPKIFTLQHSIVS